LTDTNFEGARSQKSLDLAREYSRYQRGWFEGVRARAAAGEPFAVVNADAPQEIFRVLDIPYVVTQWWSSVVAAKQKAGEYMSRLRALGYPDDREAYTALSFASSLDPDPSSAPWVGLPRPTILHAVASGDAMRKLFEAWARHTGADCLLLERSSSWTDDVRPEWWALAHDRWSELIEADRLGLMTAELEGVVRYLEERTGRRWSEARFREVMALVNEQEEYYLATRDLIAAARPAPVSIADTMPATMIPQWHRGSTWGRDAAKALYDNVAARVTDGVSRCPDEQVRLMWIGRGMWFNMGFYEYFEHSHGAVFVWSIYLALAADGYIRRFQPGEDPMRALAARFVTMGDELRSPTWASQWHLKEARSHGIDGVVSLGRIGYFDRLAFERGGLPLLELDVSHVDASGWDDDAIRRIMATFIEEEAGPVAAERRLRERAARSSAG
jgi:2-hydroxyglutaryl-CoA dehydratase, D-component